MSVYRFLRKCQMLLCRPTDDGHNNLSSRVPRWTTLNDCFTLRSRPPTQENFITWPKRLINGRPTKIVDIDQDNGLWTAACRPNNPIFASNSSAVGRFLWNVTGFLPCKLWWPWRQCMVLNQLLETSGLLLLFILNIFARGSHVKCLQPSRVLQFEWIEHLEEQVPVSIHVF